MCKAGIAVSLIQGISPPLKLRLKRHDKAVRANSDDICPAALVIELQANDQLAPRILAAEKSYEIIDEGSLGRICRQRVMLLPSRLHRNGSISLLAQL